MIRAAIVIERLTLFTHRRGVTFDCALLIEPDAPGVSLDETAIEDAARQVLVIVGLDRFEIAH